LRDRHGRRASQLSRTCAHLNRGLGGGA
jgi:hypothetical protein